MKRFQERKTDLVLIIISLVLFSSCNKEETLSLLTESVSAVTYHSAESGFEWSGSGDNYVEGGICYGVSPAPVYGKFSNSTITLRRDSLIKIGIGELQSDTRYYARSFLIRFTGTAKEIEYGNEVEFTTLPFDNEIKFSPDLNYESLTDNEGNSYRAISIGNQVWMAENLRVTTLNDGTPLEMISFGGTGENNKNPAYGWYNSFPQYYRSTFGTLYNWYAVNSGRLCPAGWHVPSGSEWETLIAGLGGYNAAGNKLRETGTTHWDPPNDGSTNESGFTALPALFPGGIDGWWSVTRMNPDDYVMVWCYFISYINIMRTEANGSVGMHVRCLKNR